MTFQVIRLATLLAGAAAVVGLALHEVSAEGAKSEAADIVWHDATTLTVEGKGWADTEAPYDRLPAKAKGIVRPPVWSLSRHSAGICVRFRGDAPYVRVRWTVRSRSLAMPHMAATGVSGVDLYAMDAEGNWHFIANGRPVAKTNEARFGLMRNAVEHRLYLPLYNSVEKLEIGVPVGSHLSGMADEGKRPKPVAFYGTSITQGGCASRPGMAYVSIVGRMLNVPVINLGFSGNGKMDMELADLLGEIDAAVYVVDCLWNMTPDMVAERVEPFVVRLRRHRPATPILLAEDCNCRDAVPTTKGRILRQAVEKLQAQGVGNIHFLSAKGMLGEDDEGTVDGCHPTDLGMMRMAKVFAPAIARLLQ